MHRFKNVLFSPLGDHENPAAARRVSDLAERNGAKLTMFGVVPEPSRFQRAVHRADYIEAVDAAEATAISAKLRRCAPNEGAVNVQSQVVVGDPALQIIERVLTHNHDLVVVTTDDDAEDHATIKRLLRKCPCPVWVMRSTRARVQRVLAAIDPDPANDALNRTILELASSMTRLYGGELHLVVAWELYGEATMRGSAFMQVREAEVQELLETERKRHREALDTLLASASLDDEPWQIHLRKGSPSSVIPRAVQSRRINLLVMGTVARTGITGLVIGNTAENVLDHVRSSVIAVKPPGFISPLAAGRS